jgi:PKD repeat protein
MLLRIAFLCLVLFAPLRAALALEPGFVEEDVGAGWTEVAGLSFDANGRAYVWERAGRVWIVENGVKRATPLIDIHDEVGGWRDFGLLGFALHPNFEQNGWIYLYYVVDRHHLFPAEEGGYDPNLNVYFEATIGRITRYTARASDGFNSVDPASRLVLAGATPDDGCPILYESHGTGSLVFGSDGTLLAGCGDGASYSNRDTGSQLETYYVQALGDGIITPVENVGAYRAQLVDSLSGKLWRIDPNTGAGVPGNPFYEPGDPDSKASRVWALGVRNPYRMTLRPGTGSHDPLDGDPGTIYLGDVGYNTWEDLHVVKQGGQNLGWPAFEGIDAQSSYFNTDTQNLDAPNPLHDGTSCNRPYFYFRELIRQESLNPSPSFPNPCGGAITSVPTFVHSAPEVDWRHGAPGPARTKTFSGSVLVPVTIGAVGSPIVGESFGGNASTGGVWYTGTQFPALYQNSYFHADYGAGWIRNFGFDANDQPNRVDLFHDGADGVVHVSAHPSDGSLYYVSWTSAVRRVRWAGLGNEPPAAVASADARFGQTPLTVAFSSAGSSDPEGQPLSYLWNFGDGATSTAANPTHVFSGAEGVPTNFTVTLTVTDATLLTDVETLVISLENSPPQVAVTSPADGTLYPLDAPSFHPLLASFNDAEHGAGQLTCAWRTTLHHNNHSHTEPVDPSCSSSTQITPVGCDGNVYFYTVSLTVTDPLGLEATDTVTLLPDCENVAPVAVGDGASVAQGYSVAIDVLANDGDTVGTIDPGSVEIVALPLHGSVVVDAQTGVVTYTHDGSQTASDSFSYRVYDVEGLVSNVANVSIQATNQDPQVSITSPVHLSTFTPGSALSLQASASDPEDGVPEEFHWEIWRIRNGALEPGLFVWDGPSPPAYTVPAPPAPSDRISYLVKLTVTDRVGRTASDFARVVPAAPPANQSPVALFTRTPASGQVPLTVTFDASSTFDADGDYLSYDWSFGDGTFASGSVVSHTYLPTGVFTALLTVTDAVGATSISGEQISTSPSGLRGDYYDNINLTNLLLTRTDVTVDFDWGSGSPAPAIGANTFSVRWTGHILPAYTETYTFYTFSDDGIRLWVDDVLVIDHWTDHGPTEASGEIALTAGALHSIRLEYYENGGGAVARLSWSSPSQPKQIVPAGRLVGPGATNAPPVALDDVRTLAHATGAELVVLANDGDPDGPLDPSSVAVVTPALHGTLEVDPASGRITYTHTGTSADSWDSFRYTVEDGQGTASAPATVWLALVPPPQVAIASPTPGETWIGSAPLLAYTLSGYLPFVGGARFRIDAGPWTTETSLVGSFAFSDVAPGPHSLEVELLSPALAPLGTPGASAQVAITSDFDADGDGFGDASDNCPLVANDQTDGGGLGASGPDGIGDACQCGDLDVDGDADASDAERLRQALADPFGAELSPPAHARCSVVGDPDSCDVLDVVVLARANAGLEPPLAQSCIAAQP